MSWIILEGLDRTGKSSVADLYKSRGYEVVHFSAPDKKYFEDGYIGPSYFEDIMEMYVRCSGMDIVFDRSIYGELVWPQVYNRERMLTDEEMDELIQIEEQNGTQHIIMYDPDVKSHWQRCVDNNEPLTEAQFKLARKLFDEVATKRGFGRKKITDFGIDPAYGNENRIQDKSRNEGTSAEDTRPKKDNGPNNPVQRADAAKTKLEKANAINSVLANRIIKKKGEVYDLLEQDVRSYLENKLASLLGGQSEKSFSQEEVEILKLYCQRIMQKAKENK